MIKIAVLNYLHTNTKVKVSKLHISWKSGKKGSLEQITLF